MTVVSPALLTPVKHAVASKLQPAWRFSILIAGALAILFGPAIVGNEHPIFRDGGHWYAPLWQWARDCWAAGIIPLWDPLQNLGESHIADGTSSVFYPGKILFALPGSFSRLYTLFLAIHVGIAGATMYRLCRIWNLSSTAAMVGGLSYALSGSVFYQIYNAPFLVGAAWLPLALEATVEVVLSPRIGTARKLGIALSLMLLGGDSQTAYHVLLILLALLLCTRRVETVHGEPGDSRNASKWKSIWFAAIGLALAVAMSAVQLFPSSGRVANSERADFRHARTVWELSGVGTDDFAWDGLLAKTEGGTHHHRVFDFSVGPWRLVELAFPNVFGYLMPQNSRWLKALPGEGRTWTPSLYFGLIPLGCVVVTIANRKSIDRRIRWMLFVAIFFVVAAMGVYGVGWLLGEVGRLAGWAPSCGPAFGGLYWLLTVLLPGYVYFRYPAKLWVIAAAGLSVAAAAGWDLASRREKAGENQTRKSLSVWFLRWAVFSIVASLVAFFLLSDTWPNLNLTDRTFGPIQIDLVRNVVLLSLFSSSMVSLAGCLLLRSRSESTSAKGGWRSTALLLVVAVDLVVAVRPHLVTGPLPAATNLSEELSLPTRQYRHAIQKKRPTEWSSSSTKDRMREIVAWDATHLAPQYHHQQNVGLVNSRTSIDSKAWGRILNSAGQLTEDQFAEFLTTIGVGDSKRAWLVRNVELSDQTRDIREIWFPDGRLRDVYSTAIVEKMQPLPGPESSDPGACEIVSYSPNTIKIEVRTNSPALLVLSETFDAGWRANISTDNDSQATPAEILRVNGVMRGVQVDEETTAVTMRYLPTSLLVGSAVSIAGWSFLILGWWYSRFNS